MADDRKAYQVQRREKTKRWALSYLGGKCRYCRTSDRTVLRFMHKVPQDASFQISQGLVKKWEALAPELDKCFLICRQCWSQGRADDEMREWDTKTPDTDKHSYEHDWIRARWNKCTVCHQMLSEYNEERRTRDSAANRWYEAEGVRWHRQLQAELDAEGVPWDPEEWKAEN